MAEYPWGLYDSKNKLLGLSNNIVGPIVQTLEELNREAFNGVNQPLRNASGSNYGVISGFDFRASSKLASHPVEKGGFASFNKAQSNSRPSVTIAVGGTLEQRQAFIAALDAAKKSTNVYSVVTPEVTYSGYSIIEYAYRRTAQNGAFMLVVEIMLEEVREISVAYSTTANAQNAQSTGTVSNGMTQAQPSTTKISKSLAGKLKPW